MTYINTLKLRKIRDNHLKEAITVKTLLRTALLHQVLQDAVNIAQDDVINVPARHSRDTQPGVGTWVQTTYFSVASGTRRCSSSVSAVLMVSSMTPVPCLA